MTFRLWRCFKIHVNLGKKGFFLVFSRVYVCVKAKLTFVIFFPFIFSAPFPNLNLYWSNAFKKLMLFTEFKKIVYETA